MHKFYSTNINTNQKFDTTPYQWARNEKIYHLKENEGIPTSDIAKSYSLSVQRVNQIYRTHKKKLKGLKEGGDN